MTRDQLARVNSLLSIWEAMLYKILGYRVFLSYDTVKTKPSELDIEDYMSAILLTACDVLNISSEKILGKEHVREYADASAIITKIIREKYDIKILSDKKLGIFLNRDRTTSINRLDRANDLLLTNVLFRERYNQVKQACQQKGLI